MFFLEPFVLYMSELTEIKTEIVHDLIETTLSPKTKDGVMTTYAQFIQKGILQGKTEGKIEGKIEMLWKLWRKGFAMELMIELSDLPEMTLKLWITRFETLQKCRLEKKTADETAKIVQLTGQQVSDWWAFFEKMEKIR
jgi:hypothetical protein